MNVSTSVTDLVEDGHVLTLQDFGFMGETWRADVVTMATGLMLTWLAGFVLFSKYSHMMYDYVLL